MGEFTFYCTEQDSTAYLRLLVDLHRFTFVENKWYNDANLSTVGLPENDLLQGLRKAQSFYLCSSRYARMPLAFSKPTKTGLTMIDELRGGPALRLHLPVCFEREGRLSVGLGYLSYQPRYEDGRTGELFKAPEALATAYQQVRALLRRNMVKRFVPVTIINERGFRPGIEGLWLGKHAVALIESGEADIRVGIETRWWSAKDLAKTRSDLLPLVDEYDD